MKSQDLFHRFFYVISFVGGICSFYLLFPPNKKQELNYNVPVNSVVLGKTSVNLVPNIMGNQNIERLSSEQKELTGDEFFKTVEKLPNGFFKSNILFLISADYNGDSEKMNEVLKTYGLLLREQLKKEKND